MADEKSKHRTVKKSETVREKAERTSNEQPKNRRLKQTATSVKKPIAKVGKIGKKEFYIPLPDNKLGRFLNKRRSIIPKYFKEAWKEFKQVIWPTKKQTAHLTFAVFVFAIVFGTLIAIVDYGLDKVFRKVFVD